MSGLPDGVAWTKTARTIFKWIPFLGEAETKLVFALYEITYGEGKPLGVRLQVADLIAATGLSDRAVRAARASLDATGAIAYKPGKNTRTPGAYKVLIGWKPVAISERIPAAKAVIGKQPKNGNSHLNTGSKSRDTNTGTKSRNIPALKAVILNTNSKTKEKTPPVLRTVPQGTEKVKSSRAVRLGDHPATIDECREWHQSNGFTVAQADEFWHYHEANGWRQGKAATPLKSWTSAAHYWHRPKDWQQSGRGSPHRNGNGSSPPAEMTTEAMKARTLSWLTDTTPVKTIDITPRKGG